MGQNEGSTPNKPYRTTVMSVTDAAISGLTLEIPGREGDVVLAPAGDCLADIHSATQPTRDQIRTWIWHPDERIVISLLANHPHHLNSDLAFYRCDLLMRGLAASDQEDIYWHPIFDQLVVHELWPSEEEWREHEGAGDYPSTVDLADGMADWFRHQGADAANDIFEFKALAPLAVALANVGSISADWFRIVLEEPRLHSALASNRRLDPEMAHELATRARRVFNDALEAGDLEIAQVEANALASLVGVGHILPMHIALELHEDLEHSGEARNGLLRRRAAAQVLLESTQLTNSDLVEIATCLKSEDDVLGAVVRHSSAGPELWRRLLQIPRSRLVRRALAGSPEARHDPVVREALFRSRDAQVIFWLCEGASTAEFARAASELARKNPDALRAAITAFGFPEDAPIERLDYARLAARKLAMGPRGVAQDGQEGTGERDQGE